MHCEYNMVTGLTISIYEKKSVEKTFDINLKKIKENSEIRTQGYSIRKTSMF